VDFKGVIVGKSRRLKLFLLFSIMGRLQGYVFSWDFKNLKNYLKITKIALI